MGRGAARRRIKITMISRARRFAHRQSDAFSEPKTRGGRGGILSGRIDGPRGRSAATTVGRAPSIRSLRAATDSSRHILMTCLSSGFHFTALCLRLSYPVSRHFPPGAVPVTHVVVPSTRGTSGFVDSVIQPGTHLQTPHLHRLRARVREAFLGIQRAGCYARNDSAAYGRVPAHGVCILASNKVF